MTKFDESIAKLAWLSPYTHSCIGWKETKIRTILQIFPLIGTYYLFQKDKNNNIFIETILNELTEVQLPNNFFERIEKEQILLVVEKHQEAFENSLNSDKKYKVALESLNHNNKHVGKIIWKRFQKELPELIENQTILTPINKEDILISFDVLTLEYLKEWVLQLSKEDKEIFIDVFNIIINTIKDIKQKINPYSLNFWHSFNIEYQEKIKNFFIDFFENLIECLKKE